MRKFKQFLAITMALSMVFSTNVFATPINLDNSAKSATTDTLNKTDGTDIFADETTNNWSNGQITEEVRVNVDRASFFEITIPKEIVLNGNDGSASYEVSITGELAGDQALVVKPDDSFTLTEDGGKTTPVTVVQDKDTFNYQDIDNSVKGNGTLSASGISAGNWSGSFYFNIEFKSASHIHNSDRVIQETKSWKLVNGDFSQNDKIWASTNKTDDSTGTATWTITLNKDVEISIPYSVSSESVADKFTIKLDDITIVNAISGEESGVYETTLQKGTHSITATYTKDFGISDNNDEGQLTLNDIIDTNYGCSEDDHVHELITEITKEPTCTETGLKTYTCQNCSYIYTEDIAIVPNAHKYVDEVCEYCGNKTLEAYSWSEIAAISEAGNAASTFSVGDEKELQIGSETYHVQILGFDHDDKSDGSGKAGITVGLKEIMTTTHNINSTLTNVGGWKDSEMRTYVNNDVYNALPSDLQAVIKTVNKVSDNGNEDTSTLNTTQDKLFLFSTAEVGLNPSYDVDGQGTKYEFFTDDNSRVKYRSGSAASWWIRSACTGYGYTYDFCSVNYYGSANNNNANISYGVVFGFSI